jgi:hypothetical protein
MRELMEELRVNYPACYTTNPNRLFIFLATTTALILTQVPCERFFKSIYMERLQTVKFPIGSEIRNSKAKMLGERSYRFVNYSLYSYFLFGILS